MTRDRGTVVKGPDLLVRCQMIGLAVLVSRVFFLRSVV